jgi:hypothetical protein
MTMPLALLQGAPDKMLLYMMIAITVLVAIALGRRFFVNLFEVITAPTASLHHHGRNETFFFSLMVVFLGGVIGALALTVAQPQVQQGMQDLSQSVGHELAQGNSNPNYREMSATYATEIISTNIDTYVTANIPWLPAVLLAFWLIVGLLFWLLTKMFGAQATAGNFLGSLSYGYFFYGIGFALCLPAIVKLLTNILYGLSAQLSFDPLTIAGLVLVLYGLILIIMGIIQGAEIGGGQFIVCAILFLIVVGGGLIALLYYQFMPQASSFAAQVRSLDPSKAGFHMPGDTGGGAPPPPPSEPSKDEGTHVDGGGVNSQTGGKHPVAGGGSASTSGGDSGD